LGEPLAYQVVMMKGPRMTTGLLSHQDDCNADTEFESRPENLQWTVSLKRNVRADARQLFHALTVPEYMETWVSFPDDHPSCLSVASRTDHEYSITHWCSGRATALISGIYLVCQRHRLALSWRAKGTASVDQTYVDIRLRGNFESTTVLLRHSGFDSREAFDWHKALWSTSLDRLACLYGAAVRAGSTTPRGRGKATMTPAPVNAN
jgi:uncharacterized protein YndB with AHSA1/START domain